MRKRIETFIPNAIAAVRDVGIADNQGKVPKQFNGYVSAFGTSIRQAGVVPTVLFFSSGNAEKSREKVVEAIERILGAPLQTGGQQNPDITRDAIDDATAALKLAVRTFELTEDPQ